MLLKISFLLSHLFCSVKFEFSWFHNTKQSSEILILKIEMLLEFQSKTNHWVLIDDFGFALDSSDIGLWNIDLLDTYSFRFVRYRYPHFFVSKTSSRRLQNVFARCLRDVLEDQQMLRWRRVEDVLKICLEDVFKTSL